MKAGHDKEEAQTTIYAAADHDVAAAGPEGVTVPGDLEVSCAFCGKRSFEVPSVSATDVGVMSPEEAGSRTRAAMMILRLNRRQDEVPVYSLVDADDEHTEDDPMVIPRKTFTLRTVYPAAIIEARILQAHDELRRDNPCRIVILVEDGQTDPARLLLARLETALIAVAEIREYPAARRPRALTAIAIPRSPEQAIQ